MKIDDCLVQSKDNVCQPQTRLQALRAAFDQDHSAKKAIPNNAPSEDHLVTNNLAFQTRLDAFRAAFDQDHSLKQALTNSPELPGHLVVKHIELLENHALAMEQHTKAISIHLMHMEDHWTAIQRLLGKSA